MSSEAQNDGQSSTEQTRKSRILFGSCTSLAYPQPLWPIMKSRNATAFVWAGDAIYADTNTGANFLYFPPRSIYEDATPELLRQLYDRQLTQPGYSDFLSTNITVFGTFDDHDFGSNNGDKTYPHKRESAMEFVRFTGESSDSPIAKRAREGLGLYGVKVFDFNRPVGKELVPDDEARVDPDVTPEESQATTSYSRKSVAVFVLDCRSNKTPWKEGWQKFKPNYDGDFLGERQWEWFGKAIRRSRASVNVIVNGLQVHSDKYPDGNIAEEWSKFPAAQHRLYNTILQSNARAPILVSGDVHMAQLMRKDCARQGESSSGRVRPLMELTTSGMTHSWGTSFCSKPESLVTCRVPYTRFMSRTIMRFGHWICPWTELVESDQDITTKESGGAEGAKKGKQFALELNFGEMEFDWKDESVTVRVLGKDEDWPPLLSTVWKFDQLNGSMPMPGSKVGSDDYLFEQQAMTGRGHAADDWICVSYRGLVYPAHAAFGVVSTSSVLMFLAALPFLLTLLGAALIHVMFRKVLNR